MLLLIADSRRTYEQVGGVSSLGEVGDGVMQCGTDANVVQELRGELQRAEAESTEIIDVDTGIVHVRAGVT